MSYSSPEHVRQRRRISKYNGGAQTVQNGIWACPVRYCDYGRSDVEHLSNSLKLDEAQLCTHWSPSFVTPKHPLVHKGRRGVCMGSAYHALSGQIVCVHPCNRSGRSNKNVHPMCVRRVCVCVCVCVCTLVVVLFNVRLATFTTLPHWKSRLSQSLPGPREHRTERQMHH